MSLEDQVQTLSAYCPRCDEERTFNRGQYDNEYACAICSFEVNARYVMNRDWHRKKVKNELPRN